jgi:hypothetical protein
VQATEDEVSSDEENDEENEEYLKSLEPEKWKVWVPDAASKVS